MKDTWTLIDDRIGANNTLYKRMDETEKMLYMDPGFQLMNLEGTAPQDRVINVTGNKAASYGNRVIETLAGYKFQTVVEGDISKTQSHKVEQWLNDTMTQTNDYLSEHFEDIADLYTFWAKHICNRGRIGAIWMSWLEDGEYKIHCVPLDMRWTPHVKGQWIAPIYFRQKDDLEAELERYAKMAEVIPGAKLYKPSSGFSFSSSGETEVRDYWNSKKNELWIEKKLVFEQPNNYGRYPAVTAVAPSGFQFRSKGYLAHEGEDIYFLIRLLDKEINRSLSIEQTLGQDILYPPMEREVETLTNEPSKPPPKSGQSLDVRKGERHQLVPRGDINNANRQARVDMFKMYDDGAPMSPRSYNTPPSAVELTAEVELVNQILNSRVTALQMGLTQLYRLMLHMGSLSGQLPKGISEKEPKQYKVSCRIMTKDTRIELVNEARGLAMWDKAPLRYILEDIWKVEDPAGWERALNLQRIYASDPTAGLLDQGMACLDEADNLANDDEANVKILQAMNLLDRYVTIIKQRRQPALLPQPGANTPAAEPAKANAMPLVSLLGRAAGGNGSTPALPQEVG